MPLEDSRPTFSQRLIPKERESSDQIQFYLSTRINLILSTCNKFLYYKLILKPISVSDNYLSRQSKINITHGCSYYF